MKRVDEMTKTVRFRSRDTLERLERLAKKKAKETKLRITPNALIGVAVEEYLCREEK